MPDTARWRPLWLEAIHQQRVAGDLFNLGHFSSAIFHALMACELAMKALNVAGATYGDLKRAGITYAELSKFTFGQLADGLELRKGHRPTADAPWLRGCSPEPVYTSVEAIESELGIEDGKLYEACRYPDRWSRGAVAPHLVIEERHARQIFDAVEVFLVPCHRRFDESATS